MSIALIVMWLAVAGQAKGPTKIVDAYTEGDFVQEPLRFDPPNGAVWLIIEEDGRLTAHDSRGRAANLPIQCDPPKAENTSWQNCQILRSGPFKRYRKVQ